MILFLAMQSVVIPPAPQTPARRFYESNEPLPSHAKSCAELRKSAAMQKPGRSLGSGWSNGPMQVDCKARAVQFEKRIAYPSSRQEVNWQADFQRDFNHVCRDWFIGGLIRQGWQFRTVTKFTDRSFSFIARCPQR